MINHVEIPSQRCPPYQCLHVRFCGWFDANLSAKGVEEATAGGKALKEAGYKFDVAHTSLLTRAQVRTILQYCCF